MKKKITIPVPCHEKWEDFTPHQQSAHCQKCNKFVIDFTTMSTNEIMAYLESKKGQQVCGRFRDSDIQSASFKEKFVFHYQEHKKNPLKLSRAWGILVLSTFMAFLSSCRSPSSKEKRPFINNITTTEIPQYPTSDTLLKNKALIDTNPKGQTNISVADSPQLTLDSTTFKKCQINDKDLYYYLDLTPMGRVHTIEPNPMHTTLGYTVTKGNIKTSQETYQDSLAQVFKKFVTASKKKE